MPSLRQHVNKRFHHICYHRLSDAELIPQVVPCACGVSSLGIELSSDWCFWDPLLITPYLPRGPSIQRIAPASPTSPAPSPPAFFSPSIAACCLLLVHLHPLHARSSAPKALTSQTTAQRPSIAIATVLLQPGQQSCIHPCAGED